MSSPALTLLDGVRWHGDPVTGERGHALLAALVLASPRAVGVGDLVDDIDRIGAAVLLLVIALAWGVVARRRLRRDS